MKTILRSKATRKIGYVILLMGVLLVAFRWLPDSNDWTLAREKNGVKVYTRFIPGWSIKEFKAIVHIHATIPQIESVLRDAPNRCEWIYSAYSTKNVKVISNEEYYAYSAVDVPWPVSDRDNVIHWKYKKISDNEVQFDMKAVPTSIYPEQPGIVRVQRMQGFWHLLDLGNGSVEVTQQVVSEVGGSVPDWMVNSGIVESPYNTMYNLKRYVENKYAH